jgi:hypothetical protein
VLDVFRNFAPRRFTWNNEALGLLNTFGLSRKIIGAVNHHLETDVVYDEEMFKKHLDAIQPGPRQRTRIQEACAIAAYHQQTDFPVIKKLLSDDAPQFKCLTEEHALCWVHDGRLYKKLNPLVPQHRERLETFLGHYWTFYGELINYKKTATTKEVTRLSNTFESLFSTRTGYDKLDDRITKTLAKKPELLLVLAHPEIPLHNNAAELAARVQKRSQDVSLQTKSIAGTKSKDTFMTLFQTAKKLGVNAYNHLYDRVSGKYELPSLADLIRQRNGSKNPASPGGP